MVWILEKVAESEKAGHQTNNNNMTTTTYIGRRPAHQISWYLKHQKLLNTEGRVGWGGIGKGSAHYSIVFFWGRMNTYNYYKQHCIVSWYEMPFLFDILTLVQFYSNLYAVGTVPGFI